MATDAFHFAKDAGGDNVEIPRESDAANLEISYNIKSARNTLVCGSR